MSKNSTSVKLYELKPFLMMKASSDEKSMAYLIRKILREWKEKNITEQEKKLLTDILKTERKYKRQSKKQMRMTK